jgi:tetratricopeptide (TPR) repeat protein
MEQHRYDQAQAELRRALLDDPTDPIVHSMLGLCLADDEKFPQGLAEADQAVHLGPDIPYCHFARAYVLDQMDRFAEGLAAIDEAIRLDHTQPHYHAVRASMLFQQSRWQEALDSANEGLQHDPQDAQCTNLRAMALTKLGRKAEAIQTAEGNLARDPENGFSHAVQGWSLVEKGDYDKALEHFQIALRLEPDLEYARLGMLEAMKARYVVYRLMLQWFLWMAKKTTAAQWGVIIALLFGWQFLKGLWRSTPELHWILLPIMVLAGLFFLLTWIAQPLFNLLLRFNRFGRYVLNKKETLATNFMGAFIAAALAGLAGWAITGHEVLPLLAAYSAMMLLPVSGAFAAEGKMAIVLSCYAAVLGVVGLGALALIGMGLPAATCATAFLIGLAAFTWIANVKWK